MRKESSIFFEHLLHTRHCVPGTVLGGSNTLLIHLITQSRCHYCPSEETGLDLPQVWAFPQPHPQTLGSGSWLLPRQHGEAFLMSPTVHRMQGAWPLSRMVGSLPVREDSTVTGWEGGTETRSEPASLSWARRGSPSFDMPTLGREDHAPSGHVLHSRWISTSIFFVCLLS